MRSMVEAASGHPPAPRTLSHWRLMLSDSRDIIRRLQQDGFVLVSVRGSHHKFRHPDGRIVIVTHPRRDIPGGTVRSIYTQAGWQRD